MNLGIVPVLPGLGTLPYGRARSPVTLDGRAFARPMAAAMIAALMVAALTSLAKAAPAGVGLSEAGPADQARTVGVLEPISVRTAHPYAREESAGSWQTTLAFHGATYVRVHFSGFDLMEGDWLEIAAPDGTQAHTYSGRGPHGTGDFWAFAVFGDTAVLKLHAPVGGGDGIEIDGVGRGFEPVAGRAGVSSLAPDSSSSSSSLLSTSSMDPEPGPSGLICGVKDWQDAKCYEETDPAEYKHSRAVAIALIGCCRTLTAFKVSDSGQFMYNSRPGDVASTELRLDFQNLECGGGVFGDSGSVMGDAVVMSDPGLDYTLFSTIGDSRLIPCLQLDRRRPVLGERIYIPHHPMGAPRQLSIASDLDVGGLCVVDPLPATLMDPVLDLEIGFLCDTSDGSLGAPVISAATHRVVGLNHRGACPNSASRMDLIYGQVASVLDVCSVDRPCEPVSGGRCDCNGYCSLKERHYVQRGGFCTDCLPNEPEIVLSP